MRPADGCKWLLPTTAGIVDHRTLEIGMLIDKRYTSSRQRHRFKSVPTLSGMSEPLLVMLDIPDP